ncbi:MAG: hypothetical protein C4536_11870 [Actinobacteria bacterium]|jgi:hypothetical protein|nr:MAG: hypothetical protein C4536_11870 [Actinomycetota bacterium]
MVNGTATSVDYTLRKRSVLRDYRCGRLSVYDVCDAHPEIRRIAANVGEDTRSMCPICKRERLRLLNFVYGRGLDRDNGRVFSTRTIFDGLREKYPDFTCYMVEVCTSCNWNHLVRSIHFENTGGN